MLIVIRKGSPFMFSCDLIISHMQSVTFDSFRVTCKSIAKLIIRLFFILSVLLIFQSCGNKRNSRDNSTAGKSNYELLLEKINTDVTYAHQTDNYGNTILHKLNGREYTLKYTKDQIIDIARAVLNKGGQVDIANNYGNTPLFSILYETDSGDYEYNNEEVTVELAKLYIDMGANINFRSESFYGNSILQVSCIKGNPKAVKMLINKGANINNKDSKHGWTPLHSTIFWCSSHSVHTSRNKQIKCIALLIENGTLINEPAYNNDEGFGFTPLHLAVNTGQADIVKILLTSNANVNSRLKNGGWTPCDYAVEHGFDDILDLLRLYGGKRKSEFGIVDNIKTLFD